MKALTMLTLLASLLSGENAANAQSFESRPQFSDITAMHLMTPASEEHDNVWTAVQVSLLIALFYLLYWIKEGALD